MLLGNEDRISDNIAMLYWACNSLPQRDSRLQVTEITKKNGKKK